MKKWLRYVDGEMTIMKNNMEYRPLPDYLTIRESSIEGLGIFATKPIEQGTHIGMTHLSPYSGDLVRTPLGGFGNHSDDPNCFKLLMDPVTFWIGALKNIKAWEELTWTYTLYNIPRKKRNANIRI